MGQTFAGMSQSDPSQMGTGTKLAESGTKGLLQGFANMQNQNQQMRPGGGGGMPQAPAQPVSPAYFTPQAPQTPQTQQPRKPSGNNLNSFYGGPSY
jgi:hypothetical protein